MTKRIAALVATLAVIDLGNGDAFYSHTRATITR